MRNKIKNRILLLPLFIAFMASIFGMYIYAQKIYESSYITKIVRDQGLLKNIVRSLMLEREAVARSDDSVQIGVLRDKTDDNIKSLILINGSKDEKITSLVPKIDALRQNIDNSTHFLAIFFNFYSHINNSIVDGYSRLNNNKFLNTEARIYLNAVKTVYSSINSIILDREYITNAINNRETVAKISVQKWLDSNEFRMDTILFFPFDDTKNRVLNFISNSDTYDKLDKIKTNMLKNLDSAGDYASQNELQMVDNFKREQFLLLLEISNILESELLIQNKNLFNHYQMLLAFLTLSSALFGYAIYKLYKKINSLETAKNLIDDIRFSFDSQDPETNIKDTLLNFKKSHQDLKASFDYLSKLNEIKNTYLKKIAKKHNDQMSEKLHSISFLRKNLTSIEQIKALSNLEESYSKSSIDFKNLANIMHFESKTIELNEQPFEPQDIFNIALESRVDEIKEKKINYVTFIDPKIQTRLIGDKDKILSVISNIISCAVYQCNKYSKILVEIKQTAYEKNRDMCNIKVVVSNNAEQVFNTSLLEQEELLNIVNEYVLFWLSISDMYLKSLGSKLDIKSTQNLGNEFSFELTLKTQNIYRQRVYEGSDIQIAYINDSDKDYNNFFKTTLSSMGINFDAYATRQSIDALKEYNIILSRKNEDSPKTNDIVYITDPLTPSKIEQFIQKNIDGADSYKFILTKPHVLIMEENQINLGMIKHAFEDYNVEISTTSEYRSITDVVKKRKFDIIFIDTVSKRINQIEVARRYKNSESGKHTPIVAMLSNTSNISSNEALSVFDDVIKKPFNKAELRRILANFIPNFDTFSKIDDSYVISHDILIYKKTTIENKVFSGALDSLNASVSSVESINDFIQNLKDKIFGVVMIDDSVKDFDIQRVLEATEEARIHFGANTKLFIFSNKPQIDFSIKHYVKILSPQTSKNQLVSTVKHELFRGGENQPSIIYNGNKSQ